jgi:hypothetical protein
MIKLVARILVITVVLQAASLMFMEEMLLTTLILVTIALITASLVIGGENNRVPRAARASSDEARENAVTARSNQGTY